MNLTEAIYARRSFRTYTDREVDDETVHLLLRAAIQAPSAMNAQPWAFVVIQDRAVLDRYSERAKRMLLEEIGREGNPKSKHYEDLLRSEDFDIFYAASTLIVICTKEHGPYSDADCWLAAENLMLTATDMGLATCVIGFAIPALNTPEAKDELRIPTEGRAIAPILVGYGATPPASRPRAEPRILSWRKPFAKPR